MPHHEPDLRLPVRTPAVVPRHRPRRAASQPPASRSRPPCKIASGFRKQDKYAVQVRQNLDLPPPRNPDWSELAIIRTPRCLTTSTRSVADALSTTTISAPEFASRVEAGADLRRGVVGHDDNTDSAMCHFAPRLVRRNTTSSKSRTPLGACICGSIDSLVLSVVVVLQGNRSLRGAPPESSAGPVTFRAAMQSPRRAGQRPGPTVTAQPNRPRAVQQHRPGIMPRQKQHLVACHPPHRLRMPAAQRRVAPVPGHGCGTYTPAMSCAAQRSPKSTSSRYDSKLSSSRPTLSNSSARNNAAVHGADQMRAPARATAGPSGLPLPARQAAPPRHTRSKVPSMRAGSSAARILPVANQASLAGSRQGEVIGRQFHIAVEHRDPFRARFADAAIHRGRETRRCAPSRSPARRARGPVRRAVGRAVVHDHQLVRRAASARPGWRAVAPAAPRRSTPARWRRASSEKALLHQEPQVLNAVPPRVQLDLAQPRRVHGWRSRRIGFAGCARLRS